MSNNSGLPCLIFCPVGWQGEYERDSLSTHSPFVGRMPSGWNKDNGVETNVYEWAQHWGKQCTRLALMCDCLGVDLPKNSYFDDMVDAWVRLCNDTPLMLHLVPDEYANHERMKNVSRLLQVGDARWTFNDVVRCSRAVLLAKGYKNLEARTEIRSEYDDQDYSDRDVVVFFLKREGDPVGYGGDEVCMEIGNNEEPLRAVILHCHKLLDGEGGDMPRESFVYDLMKDKIYRRDLASGIHFGR